MHATPIVLLGGYGGGPVHGQQPPASAAAARASSARTACGAARARRPSAGSRASRARRARTTRCVPARRVRQARPRRDAAAAPAARPAAATRPAALDAGFNARVAPTPIDGSRRWVSPRARRPRPRRAKPPSSRLNCSMSIEPHVRRHKPRKRGGRRRLAHARRAVAPDTRLVRVYTDALIRGEPLRHKVTPASFPSRQSQRWSTDSKPSCV